jgi:pSer/pThr/pTyr-binding forkhead associated (FHA) protein
MCTDDPGPIRLVALDGQPDILVGPDLVVLGRHPHCDVQLDSIRVSRHHCCLTASGGEVLVRDLGSTNGIRINGRRVGAGRIKPGDELIIAHLRFRLESRPADRRPAADPACGLEGESRIACRSP